MTDKNHINEELTDSTVRNRAVRGVTSLFFRQVIIRVMGLIGMLVLARILTPEMFGVFAVANFVVLFFEMISSMGLGAALIRKKEAVNELELRTVFTIQQCVILVSFLLLVLFATDIAKHYELEAEYVWLIRVLGLGLLLASLKTIPSIILQRNLRHDKLALAQVVEYMSYIVCAVVLAYMGYGVWALVVATLVRGIVGVSVLLYIVRWRPGFGFEFETAMNILRFGLPIQAMEFVTLANNALIPLLVGSFLGMASVGIVNFAKNLLDSLAFQPLLLLGKVQLRVFGRLQDENVKLIKIVNQNIFVGGVVSLYLVTIFVSVAPLFIEYVVTNKWEQALPLIYVMSAAYVMYTILVPYGQLLKAKGDAKTLLKMSLLRLFINAFLITLLVVDFEVMAYAISTLFALLVSCGYIVYTVHKNITPSLLANILPQILVGSVVCMVSHYLMIYFNSLSGMFILIIINTMLFFFLLATLKGVEIAKNIDVLMQSYMTKKSTTRYVMTRLQRLFCKLQLIKLSN